MKQLFDLKNKTILVTGGAYHIGKAMSEALACYGADVIIASRKEEQCINYAVQLSKEYGTSCMGHYVDISDEKSVSLLFDNIINRYNKIDVLINVANFNSPGILEDITVEQFSKGIEGTIISDFIMIKETIKRMKVQNYGNIINIGTIYGIVSPNPCIYENTGYSVNPANYGAGKAAIIQLTKYIAGNYAKFGIRANCISPGSFPNEESRKNVLFIEKLSKNTPLGRIGTPEDLKGITVFLASESSAFITGQNIIVDGGWTIW